MKIGTVALALKMAVLTALASCASAPIGKKDLLIFLQDGQTTRQDVYLHLGIPSEKYEESRIVTYRIGENDDGMHVVMRESNWSGVRYSLVLSFGEKGLLRRYSLVRVGTP